MKHVRNITSKGQVTIPKDIRKVLGIEPGGQVGFEIDEGGEVRLRKPDQEAERARKAADFQQRLREARKYWNPPPDIAKMDGLEYQRWIREKPEV
jgi:antitoxin PrlF